jgi:hypothetical protein
MSDERFSMSAVVFGLVFLVLGGLFMLDALEVIDLDPVYILPALLIGLGIGVIAGSRRRPA